MSYQPDPHENSQSQIVPKEEIDSICRSSKRVITNMKLVLPYFTELLKEGQPNPNDASATRARENDSSIFSHLVQRFDEAYTTHCLPLSSSLTQKPKTYAELSPILTALPFHNLLEATVRREHSFARVEQEYLRRQAEMMAYVEQVRKYGLKGGVELKEPMAYWDERIGEVRKGLEGGEGA